MPQSEISELLHGPAAFHGLFCIDGKTDGMVEPGLDLRVMSLLGDAGRALHHVAITRAIFCRRFSSLLGPEVLLFQKILIAEARPQRPIAPSIKRESSHRAIAGMRDLNRAFSVEVHVKENVHARILWRRDGNQRAQFT